MSYSSAERVFYQRHYNGGLQTATPESLGATEQKHFIPGKRYHLMLEELDGNRSYGTAVELGCSTGDCVVFINDRFRFSKVIGLDIAFPDDINEQIPGITFQQANGNNPLPLADGSVDVFVAMMVIEHLFDPFQSFAEIKRILAPEGRAFVNLPLVTSIKNRMRLMLGRLPETSVGFDRWYDDKEWDGNHLHYFSLASIRRLAAMNGLAITRVAGVGSNHRLKSFAPTFLANEISFVLRHAS